jgi:RHS repeat-associated protein
MGASQQPYKYNDKEFIEMHGYDTYDYMARGMYPASARFTTMDPLCEKYYAISPYAYCLNNPVRNVDPDGRGVWDEIKFTVSHPLIALKIGDYSKGSTNISTNAVRFSTRIGLQENAAHEGSQVNAFRHTLWQATIADKFGGDIAKQVGDAHEENPSVNLNNRTFSGKDALSQADQTIDLLNNQIGRGIADDNPKASMQELAVKTLDVYHGDGLYTATINQDGSVSITRTKISDEQYNKSLETINKLNNNGYTQQKDKEAQQQAEQAKQDWSHL